MRYLQIFVHIFCNYIAKIMKKSRNGFIFAVFLSGSTKKRIKKDKKRSRKGGGKDKKNHKRLTPERQGPGVMLYCLTCKALRLWLWITRFRAAKVRTFIEANKFLDTKNLVLSIFAISLLNPCSLVLCEKRAYSDRPASLAYGSLRFVPIHIPIR